jgi:hypothetical protein
LLGALTLLQALVNLAGAGNLPVWMNPRNSDVLQFIPILTVIDGIVIGLCGLNFLQGANWARWLFTIEAIGSCTIYCFAFNDLLRGCVPYIAFRAICIFFLFLPGANAFFSNAYRR